MKNLELFETKALQSLDSEHHLHHSQTPNCSTKLEAALLPALTEFMCGIRTAIASLTAWLDCGA